MKRLTLIFFIVVVAAHTSSALDLSWGFKGELLFSGLTGSHSGLTDFSGRDSNGLSLGGFVVMGFKKVFSIKPEVLLELKGDVFENTATDETINLSQLYLEIPIICAVSFPLPAATHIAPKVFAGPYLGIHLASWGEAAERIGHINFCDFGIVVGIGIEMQSFFFELAHSVGLTPVSGDLAYDTHFISMGIKCGRKHR